LNNKICFRFLYYEATNQIGADPRAIEFCMPGMNQVFFMGTEGCDLVLDILSEAEPGWNASNGLYAERFLDKWLPSTTQSGSDADSDAIPSGPTPVR
jgi:hypothetical protein